MMSWIQPRHKNIIHQWSATNGLSVTISTEETPNGILPDLTVLNVCKEKTCWPTARANGYENYLECLFKFNSFYIYILECNFHSLWSIFFLMYLELIQVTLEVLNSDLSKFSISRSKTAVPFFYSIKLSKFTPYLSNFRSLEVLYLSNQDLGPVTHIFVFSKSCNYHPCLLGYRLTSGAGLDVRL